MQNRLSERLLEATIISIRWERVIVHIDVQLKYKDGALPGMDLDFYAVDKSFAVGALFQRKVLQEGLVRLSLNITNTGDCKCLRMGSYQLYACNRQDILAKCVVDPAVVPEIENYSRSFLHHNRGRGYLVNFYVSEEDEAGLALLMHTMDAAKVEMEPPSDTKIMKSAITGPLITLRKNAGRMRWRYCYRKYVKHYQKRQKTIMFMTEQSDKIGGNLAAVYKRICERGLDKEYTTLFSARPQSYIKQKRSSTKELLKKLAKCDMVFVDDHVPLFDWLELDKRTSLIQLWHAGAGFKSSGYSRWGHIGCPAPVSCHRQYAYGISGSKNIAMFFSEVFGITDEQILPTGMPRMDEYLDEAYRREKTEELYQLYPACKGKKVILFAPTYRGKNRGDAHYPYEMIDFGRLYNFCKEEGYVVLFKMHPWVREGVPIEDNYKDAFFDVNAFPNINDLFYITEILITDYSSNIFEYSLMKKPMLFFAFDKIQYSFSRGFHRDYEEAAPGKVCYTFPEIMAALEQKDYEYEKVEEYVRKHFDYIDSSASDRVIDWILLGNLPEELKKGLQHNQDVLKRIHSLDFSVLGHV